MKFLKDFRKTDEAVASMLMNILGKYNAPIKGLQNNKDQAETMLII